MLTCCLVHWLPLELLAATASRSWFHQTTRSLHRHPPAKQHGFVHDLQYHPPAVRHQEMETTSIGGLGLLDKAQREKIDQSWDAKPLVSQQVI